MARGGYYSVDSLKGIHVLVIDGEPEGRELLTATLRYGGALATAVASGDEALQVMALIKPDVILLKPRDPWELCRLLSALTSS